VIDSHVHFWRYNPEEFPWIKGDLKAIAKDMLPSDLWESLPEKIQGVIAVQARPCLEENDYLQTLAKQDSRIKGIVGWFDFEQDADSQLEQFKKYPLIKGFRHMLQDEKNPSDYMLNHQKFNLGVKKIQQNELLYGVLIHQKDLAAAIQFCKRHDQYELVIDHLVKPVMYSTSAFASWKQSIQELAAMPHVNLKISGLVTEGGIASQAKDFQSHINTVIEYFGAERLLWGSDWPVSYATHDYATLMQFWDQWTESWSDSERLQVEVGTPARLYKF